MKPAVFAYTAPRSPGEVLDALADGPPGTRVLAGGQSLVLEMNYRRTRPPLLVDINRVDGFDGLTVDEEAVRVGPLTRHQRFEAPVDGGPLGRLLARVARHVAHPPIRARGTFLGSLAYAHPCAEWPMIAVTLGAEIELAARSGRWTVAAEEFFTGAFTTLRRPEELVVGARLPRLDPRAGVGFLEHRRTAAGFADAAVAAVLRVEHGTVAEARIGFLGAAPHPIRAHEAERLLQGSRPTDAAFAAAGTTASHTLPLPDTTPPIPPFAAPNPAHTIDVPDGARAAPASRATDAPAAGRSVPPPATPDGARSGPTAGGFDRGRPVPTVPVSADREYRRQVVAVLVRRALRQALADMAGAS